MANVKLIFNGIEEFEDSNLECFLTNCNNIFIKFYYDKDISVESRNILLDIPTSVRLVKTLKTEIAKAKGGLNG